MSRRWRWLILGIVASLIAGFAPPAQVPISTQPITLSVSAGFDGRFRESYWIPLIVQASNDGTDVEGRLVVRPETTGASITGTYSTPLSLPSGARKTAFLYINALPYATEVQVEFVDNQGLRRAIAAGALRSIQPQDQLFVVVSGATGGSVDMTGAKLGGYEGYQANWPISYLPDRAAALGAVNALLLTDVDTGQLSAAQRQALGDWVTQGGHLLVTGGPNWQSTSAGVTELLPLTPEASTTLEDLGAVAEWVGDNTANLVEQTVIATGLLLPEARVLVETGEGTPLVVRRELGEGVVDYLAADPGLEPLRGWSDLSQLWFTLGTTLAPHPSWSHGVVNWDSAVMATEILPGFDLLPDVLPLCGFLVAYIALVGPVNYLILSRLNRREYAWVTIPVLIVVFSVLAWVTGFNLRGTDATLSRLSLVQTWNDSNRAQAHTLIGLLSPRRGQYSMAMTDGSFLRSVAHYDATSVFGTTTQFSTDIQQTDVFKAANFSVDASFIALFNTNNMVEKPDISGQVSLFYEGEQQAIRGSVRNDSGETLNDPVILVRGTAIHLNGPLEPGDQEAFRATLPGEGLPSPAAMMGRPSMMGQYYGYSPYYFEDLSNQSVIDILGLESYNEYVQVAPLAEGTDAQEQRRRQLFLTAFMYDQYNSTARGNGVWLAGWTDSAPVALELEGVDWKARDTTLYLVELDVALTPPTTRVWVTGEQFTWVVQERVGISDAAPLNMSLQPGEEVVFRFTPLPNAVLADVDRMYLTMEYINQSSRTVPVELWDWKREEWYEIELGTGENPVRNHRRFLGPQNAVLIHIAADRGGGYVRIDQLTVEQRGTF